MGTGLDNPELSYTDPTGQLKNGSEKKNDEKEKKESILDTLEVDEYEDFEANLESELITTQKLSGKILKMLCAYFNDITGVYIVPDSNGLLFDVHLYFSSPETCTLANGPIQAFTNDPDGKMITGEGLLQKVRRWENMMNSRLYYITDEGKEVLSKFFTPGININWSQVVREIPDATSFGTRVIAEVSGVNLYQIFQNLYGPKDKDGAWYTYAANIVRPVGAGFSTLGTPQSNYLITINRVSTQTVDSVYKDMGVIGYRGVPMVRSF